MQIINHSELPFHWNWLKNSFPNENLEWIHVSSQNWPSLTRLPANTTLCRLRAAITANSLARHKPSLLVSHGPRPAMYASALSIINTHKIPHLAFSFNFTKLPSFGKRIIMERAFKSIDRFTVFSSMEKNLYSNFFNIDPHKIDIIHWAVKPFDKSKLSKPVNDLNYICSVGSQGRDYALLMEVMSKFPSCHLHLVAHPENLKNIKIPNNVSVHYNVSFEFAAALVAHSDLMILPLIASDVPCGHVTAVMAMHLGTPVIATDSIGLHDYLRHGDTAFLYSAGNVNSLKQSLESFLDDPSILRLCAERAFVFAKYHCVEERTIEYFKNYLDKFLCFNTAPSFANNS